MPGTLYVIAAPSGAGKTSLVEALVSQTSNIRVSVSHTTRPQRPAEIDGVNYFFVDKKTFETHAAQNFFLEHAHVFNHEYGTCGKWVTKQLATGLDIILEIDWQGAEQIKKHYPEAVSIFILPPSLNSLQERLFKRQQDDEKTIASRMHKAKDQMQHYKDFDYLIINDDFATAVTELQAIVQAERLKRERQLAHLQPLLADLVG